MTKITLMPHQEDVLNQTENMKKVAYYLDMGLGKTFVGSEKMASFNNPINLVVCQKSKVDDWVDHFKKYYEDAFLVFDLTDRKALDGFFNLVSLKIKVVGIINYDLIHRRKEINQLKSLCLMLDESSMIQNHKAKRSKATMKLDASEVIMLSGTPTSGKYENLWTQARLLGWRISHDLYNNQYINWRKQQIGRYKFISVVDKNNPYKNVERLKSKLRDHGAVFMKTEEVMTLPEQTFITVNIEASKSYVHFKKNSYVKLDDQEFIGDTTLTKLLCERQLCGSYNDKKLQAFEDLINSTDDRLIVFYNFNVEAETIADLAYKNGKQVSFVNGATKNLNAYETQNNSITLIQYQAGSMGLNLQLANKIVYFSPTLSSELYEQSKKRTHRIGQNQTCFYYHLITKKSIEEHIYKTLSMRKDFTDQLFKEVKR